MTRSKTEPTNHDVLDAARAALASAHARTKEGTAKIAPKVLLRFEKKLRLTEGVIAPSAPVTTREGLVAVLARAEQNATKRARTAEQDRALEDLRVELKRREAEGKEGAAKARALKESLAADTARLVALATPKPPTKARARATEKKPKRKVAS